MSQLRTNSLISWPNDWAKLWASLIVASLWLGVASLPLYIIDIRQHWGAMQAGISDAQKYFIVDSLGALICACALLAVTLFHKRHPRFLSVAVALIAASLLHKGLVYWFLPLPFIFPPDRSAVLWLGYLPVAALCIHVAFIVFAIKSRTLRQRLQR